MTTGNLKSATVGAVLWLKGENRQENQGKTIVAGVACLSFILGALCGGFYTHRHSKQALVPCALFIFVGYVLTWHEHDKTGSQMNQLRRQSSV